MGHLIDLLKSNEIQGQHQVSKLTQSPLLETFSWLISSNVRIAKQKPGCCCVRRSPCQESKALVASTKTWQKCSWCSVVPDIASQSYNLMIYERERERGRGRERGNVKMMDLWFLWSRSDVWEELNRYEFRFVFLMLLWFGACGAEDLSIYISKFCWSQCDSLFLYVKQGGRIHGWET